MISKETLDECFKRDKTHAYGDNVGKNYKLLRKIITGNQVFENSDNFKNFCNEIDEYIKNLYENALITPDIQQNLFVLLTEIEYTRKSPSQPVELVRLQRQLYNIGQSDNFIPFQPYKIPCWMLIGKSF